MPTLHASKPDGRGFYFEDMSEFERATQFMRDMELFELHFEFVEGSDLERMVFDRMNVSDNFARLEAYFSAIHDMEHDTEDHVIHAYLMQVLNLSPEQAHRNAENVILFEGNASDVVRELYDDGALDVDMSSEMYVDFPAISLLIEGEYDEENGYLLWEDNLEGDLMNIRSYGVDPADYIDFDAVARDLIFNSEMDEFEYDGRTFTITNAIEGHKGEWKNNPVRCKDQVWSLADPQDDNPELGNRQSAGICTFHSGVEVNDKGKILKKDQKTPEEMLNFIAKQKHLEFRDEDGEIERLFSGGERWKITRFVPPSIWDEKKYRDRLISILDKKGYEVKINQHERIPTKGTHKGESIPMSFPIIHRKPETKK